MRWHAVSKGPEVELVQVFDLSRALWSVLVIDTIKVQGCVLELDLARVLARAVRPCLT